MGGTRQVGASGSGRRDPQHELAEHYEWLKEDTLRAVAKRLSARGWDAPRPDLEAAYNQAWHALYDQLVADVEIVSTPGFLIEVTFRRAVDDLRRGRPSEHRALDEAVLPAREDAMLDQLEEQRWLREFMEGLRSELGERERLAASLCYLHGYTRPEAAEAMGIAPSRMKKVMDEVSKIVGRLSTEIASGTRCQSRQSSTKAYALGLLDPDGERHAQVRAHLRACSACRVDVLRMRGLAAVAPAPLLPWTLTLSGAVAGATGAGAGGRVRRPRPRPQVVTASIAVAVAAAAAIAAQQTLSRDDPAGPVRTAAAKAPAAPVRPLLSTAPPAPVPAPATHRKRTAKAATRKPHRARPVLEVKRPVTRTVARAPSVPVPVVPAPAPVAQPTPTPAPSPKPAPIDTSGSQEFGIEP